MASSLKLFVIPKVAPEGGRLVADIERWERLGVHGVLYSDHLFLRDGEELLQCVDCYVMVATVAALSDRLAVGTIVANVGLLHPALALRHFAQLSALYGGERVYAGIGAGWNTEEFSALGIEMPPHGDRTKRLREAAQVARELFDEGHSSLEGQCVIVRDLTLVPRPSCPPRLLIGGGSDAVLDIAGHYADHLDLSGPPRRLPLGRGNPRPRDAQRRIKTTVSDLVDAVIHVRKVAEGAHRSYDAVRFSVVLSWVRRCDDSDIKREEEQVCRAVGVEPTSLSQCPYGLFGSPERMAHLLLERRERIGISSIIVPDGPGVELLCSEVLPALR